MAVAVPVRTKFDRVLARLEQARIWEGTPEAINTALRVAKAAQEIADREDVPDTTRLRALELAYRVMKETFLDRTIPAVQRIEAGEAVQGLPPAEGAGDVAPASAEEAERAAAREALRALSGLGLIGRVMPVDAPAARAAER